LFVIIKKGEIVRKGLPGISSLKKFLSSVSLVLIMTNTLLLILSYVFFAGTQLNRWNRSQKYQRLKEESKTVKGTQLNRWNRSQKHQRLKEESKTLKGTTVVLSNPDGTTVVLSNPGVSAFPGKASADTDIHKVTAWLVMLYYRLCSRDKLHQIIGNSVSTKS